MVHLASPHTPSPTTTFSFFTYAHTTATLPPAYPGVGQWNGTMPGWAVWWEVAAGHSPPPAHHLACPPASCPLCLCNLILYFKHMHTSHALGLLPPFLPPLASTLFLAWPAHHTVGGGRAGEIKSAIAQLMQPLSLRLPAYLSRYLLYLFTFHM